MAGRVLVAALSLTAALSAQASNPPVDLGGAWQYNKYESAAGAVVPKDPLTGGGLRIPGEDATTGPPINIGNAAHSPLTPDRMRVGTLPNARTILRDLLEVPVRLSIAMGAGTVTITDDLEHTFVFPTDNEKHKFMLSATEFLARSRWQGEQLAQEITADGEVRIAALYTLAPERDRLYVSLKVESPEVRTASGTASKSAAPANVSNRVYSRVK